MLKQLTAAALAALALQLGSAAAVARETAPPPIEAFGQLPALDEVSLSPNGEQIAFVGTIGGKRVLGVRTLAGQTLGAVDLGRAKVRDIQWGDDDHVLITTSSTTTIAHLRGGYSMSKGEYYTAQSFNIRTKRFVTLLDYGVGENAGSRARAGDTTTNIILGAPEVRMVGGKPIVLVGGLDRNYNGQLFRVNIETGRGDILDENGGFGTLDSNGRVIAREEYYEDERRWRLVARRGNSFVDLMVRSGDEVAIETPSLQGLGRTNNTVLVSIPGKEEDAIWEINVDNGEKQQLDFGGALSGDIYPIHHPETGLLLGFGALERDGHDYVFFDPSIGRMWATVKASFKGSRTALQSWSRDYTKAVVRVENATDPGSLMLIDFAAGKAVKLGSDYPGVPAAAVSERRWITYKAADGLEIPAYLTLPRGRDPKNLALIVLPHGGPGARDEPGFDWWSQALASRGYAVLQPQFRGSTGFGPEFQAAGFGQYGRRMQTDLSDGVAWLAQQGIVDPKRVCIVGASYGGSAALTGVSVQTGVYRCASSVAGVADVDWKMDNLADRAGERDTVADRFWTRYMGPRASWREINPIQNVSRISVPVQLIHGRDDIVVPIQHSWRMRDAMKSANKPVEYVELAGEDHWLSRGETRTAMLTAMVSFLERHNPPN